MATDKTEPDDKTADKPDTPAPTGPTAADFAAMKDALRIANKEAAESRTKLKELDDRDKSETEKLADRIASAERRADEAEAQLMRAEVIASKKLTASQAKYLAGATRKELEANADQLLADFPETPTGDGDPEHGKPNPTNRPKEALRGGGDPTQGPDPDLRKMVANIPRS